MTHPTPEMTERIDEHLLLRTVRDAADAERYVNLSARVNGAGEGEMCARLIRQHPHGSYDDYLLVEDDQTGEVVSTTCLIPWQVQYANVNLRTAMLEMVVTDPGYRRRGLVRVQIERFHRLTQARGFDVNIIQGIPNYYRQYGYAYALDHQPAIVLSSSAIPVQPDAYSLRQATPDDLPLLTKLYQQTLAANALYTLRDEAYWRYLMEAAHWEVQLLVSAEGQAQAYFAGLRTLEGQLGCEVCECGATGHAAAMALLRRLKATTPGVIRLNGAGSVSVRETACSLDGSWQPCDQWLLRIIDWPGFFTKTGPALERRLEQSDCAGLSLSLCINLYRQAFLLRFEQGCLSDVRALGFVDASMGADGGDLCIPSDACVRLVMGYRDLDELRDAWPDIVVRPGSRHVLDVLFPRVPSCVWMPY